MLGIREPEIYGQATYNDLKDFILKGAEELEKSYNMELQLDFFQSNYEGAIVEEIQNALGKYAGIVINPAAFTHTSVAILDALKAVGIPAVEVHISDPTTREDFRKISYAGEACIATVKGEGFPGYVKALELLIGNEN